MKPDHEMLHHKDDTVKVEIISLCQSTTGNCAAQNVDDSYILPNMYILWRSDYAIWICGCSIFVLSYLIVLIVNGLVHWGNYLKWLDFFMCVFLFYLMACRT